MTLWTRMTGWLVFIAAALYMLLPLIGMAEFSLKMRRGVYSLDAYVKVLGDVEFQQTFTYSVVMALTTIAFGVNSKPSEPSGPDRDSRR